MSVSVCVAACACVQLRGEATGLAGRESRERVREAWQELLDTHFKEGAPLPVNLPEQRRQVMDDM